MPTISEAISQPYFFHIITTVMVFVGALSYELHYQALKQRFDGRNRSNSALLSIIKVALFIAYLSHSALIMVKTTDFEDTHRLFATLFFMSCTIANGLYFVTVQSTAGRTCAIFCGMAYIGFLFAFIKGLNIGEWVATLLLLLSTWMVAWLAETHSIVTGAGITNDVSVWNTSSMQLWAKTILIFTMFTADFLCTKTAVYLMYSILLMTLYVSNLISEYLMRMNIYHATVKVLFPG
eukprot:23712_1